MGRVLEKRVVAVACDLKRCRARTVFGPVDAPSTWHDEVDELRALVAQGWGFVLSSKLRAYCPEHASRVWDCSCRTHPSRAHMCTAHSQEASALVWIDTTTPTEVIEFQYLKEQVSA